jgi:hypothetical protein
MSELTPQHVLANLFDSDNFSRRVPNPEEAAKIVVRRLTDSGFDIKPWEPNSGCQYRPLGCRATGCSNRVR